MGADLYIKGWHAGFDYNDKEHYFRDSYNGTSVLWTLDLSWWQDVTPLLNKEGHLTGNNLTKFRDKVANAKQTLPDTNKLKEMGCAVKPRGQESVKGWHKYYTEKKQRLLDFLDRAIKLETYIDCSL